MIAGAWLCLLSPLAGALLITILGQSISRWTAAWISTLSVFGNQDLDPISVGTLVGVYGLWVLFNRDTERLFAAA